MPAARPPQPGRLPRPAPALAASIAAVFSVLCLATAPASAFSPGGKSIGDPIFPQVGNTGYDAKQYVIRLDYSPSSNRFERGTRTTIKAKATKDLSRFSFDFQKLNVRRVEVDGRKASFKQSLARPRFGIPGATELRKLVVTPKQGIRSGENFKVLVKYKGAPRRIVDADLSSEGWIRACSSGVCDGGFVVNEPNGAQGWFPSNNHPSDKARFRTVIEVPHIYKIGRAHV